MRPRETSKQRSVRIPLDYFKRPDSISRWKVRLAFGSALLALVWISGLWFDTLDASRLKDRSKTLASRGPLTKSHATWENNCETCHTAFRPIDGTHWANKLLGTVHDGDAKCRACHEGPAHHSNEAPGDVGSCGSCHRDHRGRESSLISDHDRDCTKCHEALDRHLAQGKTTTIEPKVAGFSVASHPEFALFRGGAPRDPGRVKFNHALHMTKGLASGTNGQALKTLADLKPEDRERYRSPRQADTSPIQLKCDSCHRPNGDEPKPGGLMRPIKFESDCRACHPLDFAPDLPAVRHGLQPAEVRSSLWETFASRFVREHPNLPAGGASRPVPGREERPEVKAAREAIEKDVVKAEKVLFGGNKCGECHVFNNKSGKLVDAAVDRDAVVEPTKIPETWLPLSAFDHSAHRNVDCKDCHSAAFPESASASKSNADVIIPRLQSCVKCHAPKTKEAGGAGYACTECHRYHGGDTHRSGIAAAFSFPRIKPTPKPSTTAGDETILALGRWMRSR